MSKDEVRAAIDDAWRSFKSALEPLTAADMEIPGACGDWTVKDILGHLAVWEARVTAALLDGSPGAPPSNIDAYNARELARFSALGVPEMITHLDGTHRALRQVLEDTPEAFFEYGSRMRREIDEATVLHYEEHGDQIRTWFGELRRSTYGTRR